MVKSPPASAGDKGPIPGLADPVEEEMATHPSIPAWRTPQAEEPSRLQSMQSQESDMTQRPRLNEDHPGFRFQIHVCVFSRSVMSDSCHPMDCSLPGSSVYGVFQARILEWVAISFSRGSSRPTD